MSSQSFVTKMKCQVTSNTTHDVLISKEISSKSYKEICSGEKKKVNIGYNNDPPFMTVENNSLTSSPPPSLMKEKGSWMSQTWEVFSIFFSHHSVEPNWLNCHFSWGWYDPDLGGWTGCMGKVWCAEYWMWWLSQTLLDWEGWGRYCHSRRLPLLPRTINSSNLCCGNIIFASVFFHQISS